MKMYDLTKWINLLRENNISESGMFKLIDNKIDYKQFEEVMEALKNTSSVLFFYYHKNNLSKINFYKLCKTLAENKSIQKCDFSRNSFSDTYCVYISKIFKTNSIITNLNLSDIKISEKGFNLICEGLTNMTSLQTLNLSNIRTYDNTNLSKYINYEHLLKILQNNKNLRELYLKDDSTNLLSTYSLNELITIISSLKQIFINFYINDEEKDLTYIKDDLIYLFKNFKIEINDIYTVSYTTYFKFSFYVIIDNYKILFELEINKYYGSLYNLFELIYNNDISYVYNHHFLSGVLECSYLTNMIMNSSSLTSLTLMEIKNKSNSNYLINIFDALKINTTITSLNLSNNNLTFNGDFNFSEVLKNNSTLMELDLSNNNINDNDCLILYDGLKNNSSIIKLNLYNNEIYNNGCKYISNILLTNTTLMDLNIGFNGIGTTSIDYLFNILKNNSSITSLNIKENKFDNVLSIADTLTTNSSLISLNISTSNYDTSYYKLFDSLKVNSTLTSLTFISHLPLTQMNSKYQEVIKSIDWDYFYSILDNYNFSLIDY